MAGNRLKRFTWNDVEIEEDNKSRLASSQFSITKADADKRLVFGWALVSATKDGQKIIDHQGDIVEQDDLEEGAYEYVLNFRDAGEEHIGTLRKKARMVESVVFTAEKLKAMGIPAGTIPYGWWIGFYVDDDTTWERIKDGTYKMFSIEGRGIREPVNEPLAKAIRNFEDFPELGMWHEENLDATKEDLKAAKEYYDKKKKLEGKGVAKSFTELLENIEKFNPYHDSRGRFTTAGAASFFTYAPGKSKAHDLAIAREKERTANAAGASTDKQENGFKPAQTKEEAIEYAKTKLHLSAVNYGDIGLDEINHINQEITKIQEKYPELSEAVKDIRTDNRNGVYAAAGIGYSGQSSLYVGTKKYGKGLEGVKQDYQKDVDSGFHPPNTDHRAIFWHEYGHIFAYT